MARAKDTEPRRELKNGKVESFFDDDMIKGARPNCSLAPFVCISPIRGDTRIIYEGTSVKMRNLFLPEPKAKTKSPIRMAYEQIQVRPINHE